MTHSVSSAEFLKSYGSIVQTALREPVSITSHGREHLVLLSAEEYRRLKQQDRAWIFAQSEKAPAPVPTASCLRHFTGNCATGASPWLARGGLP